MLDDLQRTSEIDKSNMLDSLAQYPEQLQSAADLMKTVHVPDFIKIDQVIVAGMGASGISGDLAQCLYRDTLDVPLYVNKDPDLPKWANKHTLTIFLSYSGNTEETLNGFKAASQKKCKIIGVSSGGKLQELCENRSLPFVKIPTGYQPRAAVAYLFTPLLVILERNRLIKNVMDTDFLEAISMVDQCRLQCKKTVTTQNNPAKQLAQQMVNTIPQIYGWGIYAPVAKRWRTQINENSKMIARDDVVSECNHNDLVGWSADPKTKNWSTVLIRDKEEESLFLSARLDFMKTLFSNSVAHTMEIYPKGRSKLAKLMYTMMLGDFVSCYLGVLRGVDPSPVDVITALKQRLSEL